MHRLLVTPELVADTAELYGQNVTNALLDPDTYLDDYDWCRKLCGQHRHLSACRLALTSAEFFRASPWHCDCYRCACRAEVPYINQVCDRCRNHRA